MAPYPGRELYLLHVRSKTSIRGFQEIRYRVQENIGPETFEQGPAFFAANKGWTVLPVLLPSNGSRYEVEVSPSRLLNTALMSPRQDSIT